MDGFRKNSKKVRGENKMKNNMKTIKAKAILVMMIALTVLSTTTVNADGINQDAFNNWVNSYLDPATNILFGLIPAVLVIYLLVKAIDWFKKDASGEQTQTYWSTVTKGVTVAVVALSINIILKIVSINI